MDRDRRLLLDDLDFRAAWSISKLGLAEALAQLAGPLITFLLVAAAGATGWPAAVAISVVLAIPAYPVARARSGQALPATIKGLQATAINLCAAGAGNALLALPNFFFA
jgi:hypothetical protein